MSNINNFSPNMLKTFEECQKKFFLKYVEKISLPQRSVIFEKGKKIHALANYYLKGENIEKMEKILTPDEKIAWESLKSSKYFKLHLLDTEYNLSCKVNKYWIGGRLDAFVSDENNYIILDYKTGSIPKDAKQDFQTIVYLLCADKLLKKKDGYNSLKFVYLGLKDNIEKEILLTENLKDEYEERIGAICDNINFAVDSGVFTCSETCSPYCEYNKICQ